MKYSSFKLVGLLQPIPFPSVIFVKIFMDFITGLPHSNGHTIILVIVYRLSMYGHFIALPTFFTS